MNLAEHPAHRCDPGVALRCQSGAAPVLRVHSHGAELDDLEDAPVLRQTILLIENRPLVIHLHKQRDQKQDR